MKALIYNAATGDALGGGEVPGLPAIGSTVYVQIDDERIITVAECPPLEQAPCPPGVDVLIPVRFVSRIPSPQTNPRRWLNGVYFGPEQVARLRALPRLKNAAG